jgi:hypothetical protein
MHVRLMVEFVLRLPALVWSKVRGEGAFRG